MRIARARSSQRAGSTLLDRPLIRISMPQLVAGADIAPEYVELLAGASTTVDNPVGVVDAVVRAVAKPGHLSAAGRALAAELFHAASGATDRAIGELCALIKLDHPVAVPRTTPVPGATYHAQRALSR